MTQVDVNDSALESIVTKNWVTGTSSEGTRKRIDVYCLIQFDEIYVYFVVTCGLLSKAERTKESAIALFNSI